MDWQALPNAPETGTRLCTLAEIDDGAALMLTLGSTAPTFDMLVLRSGSSLFGYLNRCSHFGVPLANQQKHLRYQPHEHFQCNVHYARYNWTDGRCVSGECAGEGLVPIPLVVVDGHICIGKLDGDPS